MGTTVWDSVITVVGRMVWDRRYVTYGTYCSNDATKGWGSLSIAFKKRPSPVTNSTPDMGIEISPGSLLMESSLLSETAETVTRARHRDMHTHKRHKVAAAKIQHPHLIGFLRAVSPVPTTPSLVFDGVPCYKLYCPCPLFSYLHDGMAEKIKIRFGELTFFSVGWLIASSSPNDSLLNSDISLLSSFGSRYSMLSKT